MGTGKSYFVELCGAMRAIEYANSKSWNNIWLETDSMLVVRAFMDAREVPWTLRNIWTNCLTLISSMNFVVTHS